MKSRMPEEAWLIWMGKQGEEMQTLCTESGRKEKQALG